jgi:adenylate cyclase
MTNPLKQKKPFNKAVIRYVSFQVFMWNIINLILTTFIFLIILSLAEDFSLPLQITFERSIVYSTVISTANGIIFGLAEYFLTQRFFSKRSIGEIIVLQMLLAITIFSVLFTVIKFMLTSPIFSPILLKGANPNQTVGSSFGYVLFLYFLISSIVVGFANRIFKMYGKELFFPLLFGKYKAPREEDRIFMFLDQKSSTSIAEQLGHLRYSEFIQDFIIDINHVSEIYYATIYQYVGDEIVLTWKSSEKNKQRCVHFYFACEKFIEERSQYYQQKYFTIPLFKAGVDCGKVVAVEIGDTKRDIAYHGDTLNTASRIQNLCNETDKRLLVSNSFVTALSLSDTFNTDHLGMFALKGKEKSVEIISISEKSNRSLY